LKGKKRPGIMGTWPNCSCACHRCCANSTSLAVWSNNTTLQAFHEFLG
jgi:hypothetical protein